MDAVMWFNINTVPFTWGWDCESCDVHVADLGSYGEAMASARSHECPASEPECTCDRMEWPCDLHDTRGEEPS